MEKQGPFSALSSDQCAICAENSKFNFSTVSGAIFRSDDAVVETSAAEGAGTSDNPPRYPITIPYRAACGHMYCYTCISERFVRSVDDGDSGWPCLRCGDVVRECSRMTALADDEDSSQTSHSLSDDEMLSFESDASLDN